MNWLFTFSIALALLAGFACCILVLIDWTTDEWIEWAKSQPWPVECNRCDDLKQKFPHVKIWTQHFLHHVDYPPTQLAAFYQNGSFGKKGPYACQVLFKFGPFRVIRFQTEWDSGDFYTWRTRIKMFWNVEES